MPIENQSRGYVKYSLEGIMKYWVIKVIMMTILFFQSSLYAAECGDLQFLKNKSPGTQVLSHDCQAGYGLSIGSQLELVAGARLWLTAFYDRQNDQQLICQNRSQKAVYLHIVSTRMPWIQVEKVKQCQSWHNNRLSCVIAPQQKFFCISGIVKKPLKSFKRQERTTSITMRSLSHNKQGKIFNDKSYIEQSVKDMRTEINLCRDLLQSYVPVELIWNVNMLGQAVDVSIITEGHNEISSCIKDVVANYPYLKPREMMTFVYEF